MSLPNAPLDLECKSSPEIQVQVLQVSQDVLETIDQLGLKLDDEACLRWKSDCPDHPRNWSTSRKTFDTGLLFLFDLFTTAVSTAGPSVAEIAKAEYNLSRIEALIAFGSMYQFGQAVGGVIFPPYSEAFGRKSVYIFSAIIYSLACLTTGLSHSVAGAVVGRFVSGVMSAVPSVIVSGSVEDIFGVRQRVWIMFGWACCTTGGLLAGPAYGSYVSAAFGWRWVFYSAAIATSIFALILYFIRESRPSRLFARRLGTLQILTGISNFRIQNPDHTPNLRTFAKTALIRPITLFFTEPIVFVVSVMSAVAWALIYLFTESLPVIYTSFTSPPLSRTQSSLIFLAIGLGMALGILPRVHDTHVLSKLQARKKPIQPEDKLIGFAFAAPSLAFGLWWLALTTPPASNLPWYATLPGMIPVGFAINEFACTLSGYLADTYTIYTSSALAALAFLRAVLAGLFPLAGEPMYRSLGANWASVVLAGVATVFCVSPVLFLRFGKGIRRRSAFARFSLKVNEEVGTGNETVE